MGGECCVRTDEEHEMCELGLGVDELFVQSNGNAASERKRQRQADERHAGANLGVLTELSKVHLESDEEQEEHETKCRD